MAGKGFELTFVAVRRAHIYNYLVKQIRPRLPYNENNRIPISPIRTRGGSENRASIFRSGPTSSPPCRMHRIATACAGMDEAELNKAVSGPKAEVSRRMRPPENARRAEAHRDRATTNAGSRAEGSIHIGEE